MPMKRVIIGVCGPPGHGATTLIEALAGAPAHRTMFGAACAAMTLADGTVATLLGVSGDALTDIRSVAAATGIDIAMLVIACDADIPDPLAENTNAIGLL